MKRLLESELIINSDGSIYHLGIKPEDIRKNIITVGDIDRVDEVTKHFDSIAYTKQNREFKVVGGFLGRHFITVISTGIGTDNVDIVLNELNFLVNFDLTSRELKSTKRSLNIFRLGTSGGIHENVELDSIVYSKKAISADGLLPFYEHEFPSAQIGGKEFAVTPCSSLLEKSFSTFKPSITLTASGFYAPQFRNGGVKPRYSLSDLSNIKVDGLPIGNIEMETAGIYGLSNLLDFEAISINAILANRVNGTFSSQPDKTISLMISQSLDLISDGSF